MKTKSKTAVTWAILAAALYAISTPVSKELLHEIPGVMMAALLYLGAGIGMSVLGWFRSRQGTVKQERRLTREELPFTVGMVVLDIAAPIFLMIGLTVTTPATVSLLNNFEIVATSLIALLLFKESVHSRLWIAIGLITVASVILSVEDIGSITLSWGSVLVLLAAVCWGLENNLTSKLSAKDPLQVVVIKGFGSGLGSLFIAIMLGETTTHIGYIAIALLLGFVAYGLSIYFYVYAQRYLGAAKTSAYYAISPFIGVLLSLIMFTEIPAFSFIVALIIMIAGTYFASTDRRST
ncbi:DMT family transporter [Paenibacillus sp. MMS20-IR301]|uniref:DMT family transporter n=1 Tax=Paenibacillus sp. MMS20-IR301 TaxID=2895946 RepID=UPI0028EADE83|nr:DMT family transporter [Paenibacillus sp. MMS20-IR301]WNS43420.1 DMT family transporter [Paenibacillus sp. MMS20-IR301]